MMIVLAARRYKAPTRKQRFIRLHDAVHITTYRTEIPILYRGVDIDYATNVVVIDRGKLTRSMYGSNIGEYRGSLLVRTTDRDILNILLRLNTVLRRLRNQIVRDTVLRVEIERGRHLETAT
jgi:KaiC/GvpD/RAD55 family RecA-like ATPase